jgi:hypothetical protein
MNWRAGFLLISDVFGGIPRGAGEVTLTVVGTGYIDDLFAGTDTVGIDVSGTLPAELL